MTKPITPIRTGRFPRHGFSLIEAVIFVTASAIVFAVAITAFARFLQVGRVSQEHLVRTVQTARFAEQFRHDVWAASDSKLNPAGQAKQLSLEDPLGNQVVYQIDDNAIHRTTQQNDRPVGRENFPFPQDTLIYFEADAAGVSAIVAPPKSHLVEGESPQGKPLRISANLGRDHRYASATKGQ